MTKKDNEKDSDRPHYYSQFWLDIAAGRRTIGGPRSDEDEPLDDLPEPVAPPRRSARNGQEHSSAFDGLRHDEEYEAPIETPRARAIVEPIAIHEEINEPELEQEPEAADLVVAEIGDLDLQEAAVEDADIPDMDLEEPVEEDADEEFFDEDEDEEDDEWSAGRGRKKAKPTRPTKPVIKQRPRREPRRGF